MTKDELKKQRLENLRKGREAARERKKNQPPVIEVPKAETPPIGGFIPPPLPPLNEPNQSGSIPIGVSPIKPLPGTSVAMDDTALKKGLGLAFNSSLKGVETLLNSVASRGGTVKYEVQKLEPEEAELWGMFAVPVLKKHFPKFEESPEYALIFVTVAIVSGKIKTKREVLHAGNEKDQIPPP